jgi:hypothetical protein
MKTFALALCAASTAALEPAVLEVVGAGAEVRFDSGSITETSSGVSVDSRANNGCTRVDGVCVYSKINEIDGALSNHKTHVEVTLPSAIKSINDDLPPRIAELETALPIRIKALEDKVATMKTTQEDINGRLHSVEQTIGILTDTSAPTSAPTPAPPTPAPTEPPKVYGKVPEMAGKSCWDILGQSMGAAESGTYWVKMVHNHQMSMPMKVYCDMERDGGGWTLVEKGATQGCFISAVGTLTSPDQALPAKLSDAQINDLSGGDSGVIRWLHGSQNWKDYGNNGHHAVPAATKIFFKGAVKSTTNTKARPFFCGSSPDGNAKAPFSVDASGTKEWETIDGYSIHYGFDTFQKYAKDGNYGEPLKRHCGVVEQEYLKYDGVDNRHCSGNHFCKKVKNYAGHVLQTDATTVAGLGSYFIGCYGEYNKLPAETSHCRLGGKPGCEKADMPSSECGARAVMNAGFCNGINWDAHAHGGCKEGNIFDGDGGCRHGSSQLQTNPLTNFEWPPLRTDTMTAWVRPAIAKGTTFAIPEQALCFNLEDAKANQGTANRFCHDRGFSRAQSQETASADDMAAAAAKAGVTSAAQTTECKHYENGSWMPLTGSMEPMVTGGNRIVRIECIKF